MKKYDLKIELKVLQSLLASSDEVKALLWIDAGTHLFSSPTGKGLITRLFEMREQHEKMPEKLEDLVDDYKIGDDVKEILAEKIKPIKNPANAEVALKALKFYRDMNLVANTINRTGSIIDKDEYTGEEVTQALKGISKLIDILFKDEEQVLYRISEYDSIKSLLEKILPAREKLMQDVVPTGFENYDRKVLGYRRGNFVILGCTTKGGKSTLALTLVANMYMKGFRAGFISLEMSKQQVMQRLTSNIANIEHEKIMNGTLVQTERKIIKKAFIKLSNLKETKTTRGLKPVFSVYCPAIAGVDKIYNFTEREKLDCVVVDYLNLIDYRSSGEMWQKISDLSKQLKNIAKKCKCVVISPVQLNEDHSLRYSKAVGEDCDVFWKWEYNDNIKSGGVIRIEQPLVRDYAPFSFLLEDQRKIGISKFVDFTQYGDDVYSKQKAHQKEEDRYGDQ